ncbi:mRNA export factor Gle1 [Sitodiplosis mosellana]|uniref:mRNA export factor Gle1 n=1 Tax=Sitodiplosis mosellana TaxID=263140 RepID=UPI00244455C5|nr:mRNA export factor Gle1 [Sitodiplosis mosellana]
MASTVHTSNVQHDVVNALAETVGNLKISTLVNAAKISPLVQERTIGPKQTNGLRQYVKDHKNERNDNRCERSSGANSAKNALHNGTFDGSKFRKDIWREVKIESDHEETPTKNILHLNDCKVISFRLAANTAEKQRRAKISTHLQEKQCQWDSELEQRLQQIRIDSAEKQKLTNAKRLEREKLALQAIEKIEAQAKQDEMKSNLKKSEMIEHSRKVIEHANQLKRQDELRLLFESINASKLLFINLYELFAKTIINHQGLLNQTGKLAEYTGKREALLECYEKIIKSVNSKPLITAAETEQFEKLCLDIKQEQSDLNSHIQCSREALSQNAASDASKAAAAANSLQTKNYEAAATTTKSPADALKAANTNEISVTDGNIGRPPIPAIESRNNVGSEDRIAKYYELLNLYQEYRAQIQPLLADVNAKKFRFNCQKGVNTPINSIAAVNAQHLQDKFEKIADLLAGKQVRSSDIPFSASEHPLGIKYCTFLLAKKFITQGTTVTSSHQQAAFPIAAVIVSIWQLFPDVGKLFLALLYIECPFFVPYFVPQQPGQSERDYFSILGYKFTDDKMEEQEQYLKRISGLQRLYSAVLITKLKSAQQHLEHPHGIEYGWMWLSNFIMLDPLPGISPTLLLEFIQESGAEMWQVYKKQFMKLLVVLHDLYMPKLEKIDSGGPFSRLQNLIGTIVRENKITPPSGTLAPNFW